jgi:hypothetical protein
MLYFPHNSEQNKLFVLSFELCYDLWHDFSCRCFVIPVPLHSKVENHSLFVVSDSLMSQI